MNDSNDKLYLCSMSFTKLHILTPDPADKMRIKDMNMEEVKTIKLIKSNTKIQKKKTLTKGNVFQTFLKAFTKQITII